MERTLILLTAFVGFYGLIISRNLIKKLLFLGIFNGAVIGFFIQVRSFLKIPPLYMEPGQILHIGEIADPLPHALVITAVVIGFATQSLSLVFVMIISQRFHTLDEGKIEILVEQERQDDLGR
ncbi:MAG TPA: cation:proton antiporter subunit C [Thermotogota bacterium]|nr:cation:proton antiporter subunit C [Thermotogota bacterium]HRW91433.1 cation:proton antiporter subunit C [Thermotogota bacterium]